MLEGQEIVYFNTETNIIRIYINYCPFPWIPTHEWCFQEEIGNRWVVTPVSPKKDGFKVIGLLKGWVSIVHLDDKN